MEDVKEDIRKNYPSLPPNYVSLAQLQERWIQQNQKQTEQKEQIASENQQQPKEKNRFSGSPRSSKKNGMERIHAQGLHIRQNGEPRDDANMVYFPRRQSDGNQGQIWEAKSKLKSKKLELRASGDAGGSGMGSAKDKKDKYNQKKRRPRVKKGLNGEDLVQTLSGNGGMLGVLIGKNDGKEEYPGYENKRDHEIVSVGMVGLAPEIGKEVNPVGFSRKPRGKQLVNDQFSNGTNSWRVEAKSRGKQVLDDQFSNSTDSRRVDAKYRGKQVVDDQFANSTDSQRVEAKSLGKQVVDDQFPNSSDNRRVDAKSRGKQVVNDQFFNTTDSTMVKAKSLGKQVVDGQIYCSTNDQRVDAKSPGKEVVTDQFLSNTGVEGSVNEYIVEVPPENGFEDEVSVGLRRKNDRRYKTKYERYKRSGNDKGISGEGNLCTREVLQDNEAEEEVSWDERRKTGKERLGSRFQGNEGNWRMIRNSNEIKLELDQQLVEEDIPMGEKERTGPKARTGKGARAYGNKDTVYHWIGRDFGDLSFGYSRKGNSSRGHRWSYGNFGIGPHRKGKQVDGGLVWVKKEVISDTNAEIS